MSSFIQGFMESDEIDKAGLRELNFDIEPENVGFYNSFGDVYKTGYGGTEERVFSNIGVNGGISTSSSIGSTSEGVVVGGCIGGAVDMMNYGSMCAPGDLHGIGSGVDHQQFYGVDYGLEYGLGYHQGAYGHSSYEEYGQEYGHYLVPAQQAQQQIPGTVHEEYHDMDRDQELEYEEYDSGRRFSTQAMYSQNTDGTSSDLSDTVSETETKLSTPESFSATIKQYELHNLKLRSRRVLLVQQLELNYDHSMLADNHLVICTHCNNRFDSILQLGHHFDKNKLVTPHKCPFDSCPYFFIGFARKAELRRHCLTKHFEKGKLTQSINQNIKQVLNNLIYSCKIDNCGKNFYRKDSLQRHLKLVHENENTMGRYCQLSGYNLENQFFSSNDSIHNEYHLILCIDGKFIFDTKWTEIPWSQPFKFADKTLILSRTRRYALRSLPVYLPNIEFGGIFDVSEGDPIPVSPLVSVPITDYWVELRHDGLFVYHIPLLGTPTIIHDSWQAGILVKEDYHYKSTDVKKTLESNSLINSQLYSRLVDLLIFLKRLPSASFKNFLYNLNKLLT